MCVCVSLKTTRSPVLASLGHLFTPSGPRAGERLGGGGATTTATTTTNAIGPRRPADRRQWHLADGRQPELWRGSAPTSRAGERSTGARRVQARRLFSFSVSPCPAQGPGRRPARARRDHMSITRRPHCAEGRLLCKLLAAPEPPSRTGGRVQKID